MNVKVVLANKENSIIIKNTYPLYLHDLSEIHGNLPNEYGIYEDEPIKTLMEQYEVQNKWFEEPDRLFPFIIMADNKPAGFMLVATHPYIPKDVDYYVYEFFLLRPYRGKNIGETAAKQIFDKFEGKWELFTHPTENNKRAQSFWHKTVGNYTSGNYEVSVMEIFDENKMVFKFNNKK